MPEINLLRKYPQTKRDLDERANSRSEEEIRIARKYGKDFFDGERKYGYGGYNYHPRFWTDTVKLFKEHYALKENASIIDVGCAKGFMMYDFSLLVPKATIMGIDISEYAIENALPEMKPNIGIASADALPFDDKSFDLVISVNTIHNLELDKCKQAIKEIQRVANGKSFISVDAWRTAEEKERLEKWILTAKTYMSVEEWVEVFEECGYTGDYYWFIT